RIVLPVLAHQTDRLRSGLRVVLARHDMHLPKEGGAHQTRDGSHRRAHAHPNLPTTAKADLSRTDLAINPAALQRQTQALLSELLTLTITKAGPQPSNSRGHLAYEATTTFAGITT
ncbi:hypothetical protein KQR54_00575, partial [Mycobacterium gordonae]|nr:hypothetical protein [Mycobacterium gordonae]